MSWVGHIDEEALKIDVRIADEEAQVTMRQLAERRQAAGRAAKPARGRKGISKVTEVNDDSLFTKPWKQGPFDSTIANQRRGRDSFGTVLHGLGFSAIPDAMSMPANDL